MPAHLARSGRTLRGLGRAAMLGAAPFGAAHLGAAPFGAADPGGYRSGTAYAVAGTFLGLLAVAVLVYLLWGRRVEGAEPPPSEPPRVVLVPDDTAPTVRLHGDGALVVVSFDPAQATVSWFARLT